MVVAATAGEVRALPGAPRERAVRSHAWLPGPLPIWVRRHLDLASPITYYDKGAREQDFAP
jgi:hypothetical protein